MTVSSSALRWPVVLFDLDGTLADSIGLIVASHQHAYRTVVHRHISPEDARATIGRTLVDIYAEHGPELAAELERSYLEFNASHIGTHTGRYDGIGEMLTALDAAGVRVGVVTSKRRASALATLAAVGLADVIGLVGTLETASRHKPDPEPLVNAMATLGADPAGTVYVGDAVVDLSAARAAGIDGIGVTWGAGLPGQLRRLPSAGLVDTPAELTELLLAGSPAR